MNLELDRGELILRFRDMVRFEDAAGTRLRVRSGSVWITQHRDARDYFVPATGTIALDRPGLALVHALEPAELVVWPPKARVSLAARVARRLAGRLARRFGPEGIDNQRLRGWHGV
jgi:DUF2917 family protein